MKEADFMIRWRIQIHVFILLIFLTIEAESQECFVQTTMNGHCCVYKKEAHASCVKENYTEKPVCKSPSNRQEKCDVLGFDDGKCEMSNSMLCGWEFSSPERNYCNWQIDDKAQNRIKWVVGDRGYTVFKKTFKHINFASQYICIGFNNSGNSNKFSIKVNDQEMMPVHTGDVEIWCFQYTDIDNFYEITLTVYCNSGFGKIEDLIVMERETLPVMPTPTNLSTGDPRPTESGDIQYVGVVVGAICIALFTLFSCLTIISARRSNQRDSRRRELHSGACPEEDDTPDVVADNAPPSYDAVMACPNMYPPTPQGTPPGTPETTPYLSLHRRALLNQLATAVQGSPQSQRQSMTPSLASQWEEEETDEQPPPYPGLGNGNVENGKAEQDTRDANSDNTGTGESTSEVSTPQEIARTRSDLSPSDLSRDERREDDNPWVLNVMGETSPRRNNTWPRNESAGDLALQVRTSGDVDGGDVDEGHESTSVAMDTHLAGQDVTEVAVSNDIQYADSNSANSLAKSGINNRASTISNLPLV